MVAKKYIRFDRKESKGKTNVYEVVNISGEYSLGIIKWKGAWRQYCFFPNAETVWNNACLSEVLNFLNQLMAERKRKKNG
jgi:hypothetical protein